MKPASERHVKAVILTFTMIAISCVSTSAPPACTVAESDRAWIDRSLAAWRFATMEIAGITSFPANQAILFSEDCVLRSDNALSSRTAAGVTWTASPHAGSVPLPDGSEIPVAVTSYAAGDEGERFFVMALPAIWEAAGIGTGGSPETALIPVLLHEASHIVQTGPYGSRLGALIERHSLPDSFNDNSVQERFGTNEEFAASVKRETDLFLEAASAKDLSEAKRLASEARRLMLDRRDRWMTGDDAYHVEAEDIWLTFEGSGQWLAYRWMIDPRGGAQPEAETLARYIRGRQWSQTEGFALVMALDRIAGPGWKRHAFGDGAKTVLEMLDEALRPE